MHRYNHVKAQLYTQPVEMTGILSQHCCIVHLAAATDKSCQCASDTCHVRQPHAIQVLSINKCCCPMCMQGAACSCHQNHATSAEYAEPSTAATLQRQALINGLLHHGNCEGRAEAGRAAGKSLQPVDDLTCACLLYSTGLHARLAL